MPEVDRYLDAVQRKIPRPRQQRQVLRALPRESAPPNLMDDLQSQLERETLLDPDQLSTPLRLAPNHWRQFLAIAAVLVLASGLGFIIFSVLPPSHPSPIAELMQRLPESSNGTAAEVAANVPTPPPVVAMKSASPIAAEARVAEQQSPLAVAQATDEPTWQLTIRADSPQQLSDETLKYLASNNIPFSMDYQHSSMPEDAAIPEQGPRARFSRREFVAGPQVPMQQRGANLTTQPAEQHLQRVIVARNVSGDRVVEMTQTLSQI